MVNLLIDMSNKQIYPSEVPPEHRFLGGRGLIAAVAAKTIPPYCDPLGPDNCLIIAPGLFAAEGVPSAQRLSVGAKSPLTGGIRESNAGGITARALGALGIKTVVISGRAHPGESYVLVISPQGGKLRPAPELAGLGAYQTAAKIQERYGQQAAALLIGPAGENLSRAACIQNLDYQGRPSRANGRGGLGAVLGAKGLKAVIVLPPVGTDLTSPAQTPAHLREAAGAYCKAITTSSNTQDYREFGTALTGDIADSLGCLPTENFRLGSFAGKSKILGKTVRRLIDARGGEGKPIHSCTPGCVVSCSNIFPDSGGREIVSPLDYQAIASIGSNLCIDNIDDIAKLYRLCNDLGIDVIEAGASLAVLMDEGIIPWGDGQNAISVLKRGFTGDYPGYLIANGLVATAQHLGVTRVAAVKGEALAAFDPRGVKGLGVTYATSPQGPDHTAGHTIRKKIDHHCKAGQIELSMNLQIETALYDTLGICFFTMGALSKQPELVTNLFNQVTSQSWKTSDLLDLGRRTVTAEHRFNLSAGHTAASRLPDFFYSEPLPPAQTVFDISPQELQAAIDAYFHESW